MKLTGLYACHYETIFCFLNTKANWSFATFAKQHEQRVATLWIENEAQVTQKTFL